MPNKVFNNERPASIKFGQVFNAKMRSDVNIPSPKFTDGENKNYSIDYGNSWSQKITSGMVNVKDKKNGLTYR